MWTVIAKLPWVTPEKARVAGLQLIVCGVRNVRSGRLGRKRTSAICRVECGE